MRTEHFFIDGERDFPYLAIDEKEVKDFKEADKEALRRAKLFTGKIYIHTSFRGYRKSGDSFFYLYEVQDDE